MDTGSIRLGLRLGPTHESADIARRAVRAALGREVSPELVENAVLCTSEIVTNAVVHTELGCELQMSFDPATGVVRIEVSDHSPHHELLANPVDTQRVGGRGLQIVSATSSRWGTNPASGGKVVWFELWTAGRPEELACLPS